MNPKFELLINAVTVVHELPGAWTDSDYLRLLKQLEFADVDEIPADQLRDYAVMALQDLDDVEASRALLDCVFGDALSDGKKQNLADEMTHDRPWEEYPDLSCHERIFYAQFLLNLAYPACQQPEINKVALELRSLNPTAESCLQTYDPDSSAKRIPEALLVRCLALALPDDSILTRLFEDQIKGDLPFTEAENILWHVHASKPTKGAGPNQPYLLTLYSPVRWTGSLEEGARVECEPFVGDGGNTDS